MKQLTWGTLLCGLAIVFSSPSYAQSSSGEALSGATPYVATSQDKLAPRRIFLALDTHGSILSDIANRSLLSGTFGYAVRGGYRWQRWGVFLQAEQNLWLMTENQLEVLKGALNIGAGGEFIWDRGFLRSSFALGPSILLTDTILDDAGTCGMFLDLHPVGFRWPVTSRLVLGFDPLSFALVAPVLSGIPLIYPQYRVTFYVEGNF